MSTDSVNPMTSVHTGSSWFHWTQLRGRHAHSAHAAQSSRSIDSGLCQRSPHSRNLATALDISALACGLHGQPSLLQSLPKSKYPQPLHPLYSSPLTPRLSTPQKEQACPRGESGWMSPCVGLWVGARGPSLGPMVSPGCSRGGI